MAALSPIRLVPPPRSARTASLRNQIPSFESLAGGSACSDRPLVTRGTECAQCCICGLAAINVRILLSPLWEAREEFLSEWLAKRKLEFLLITCGWPVIRPESTAGSQWSLRPYMSGQDIWLASESPLLLDAFSTVDPFGTHDRFRVIVGLAHRAHPCPREGLSPPIVRISTS